MKIINPVVSPVLKEILMNQIAVYRNAGFIKRLFFKRYIKKYSAMMPMAYKE